MTRKAKRPSDWTRVVWQATDVLAFDPALANTGWALVHFYGAGSILPIIGARGTFVTGVEHGSTGGILGSLERGDLIYAFADGLLKNMASETVVVHEVPVNQSNAAHVAKIEGGPISTMALRAAMRANSFEPEPIEVRTWKKLVVDNGNADKDEVAVAIAAAFPNLGRSNEHVRDALGCALGWMIKAERWSEDATS